MALFNKKKSQDAAAPATATVAPAGTGDDFSDFSPEALSGAVETEDTGKKKGKKAAADKRGDNGRGVKPGTALGLNIGNDSIKVVEATATGNSISVTAMGMVPTPQDSIANGVVMSANALVFGIRDALAQAGIKSKKVVTSISGTGALVVRIIEVPKMSDGELLDNMKMDADRYIPFPPSEVEMDFKALRELPSDPDSPNMEVLLAAAQREIVDQHVEVIQDAKLDPRAIDVEPLAAARALTHPLTANAPGGPAVLGGDADYSDVAAILNIGASGTEISILRGDILVFTRTVPSGGNAMTQALVDTLGLSWVDAEQLKREKGDALAPTVGTAAAPAASSGDDWSAFGEEAGADITAQPGDPFSDEFFEQGPVNAEPGEQHQQKEEEDAATPGKEGAAGEETPAAPETFFDFGDETEPEEKMPTIGEGRPNSFADLLGEEEESLADLPSLTPEAASAMPMASAFDFPEEGAAEEDVDTKLEEAVSQLPTIQGSPIATEVVGSTRVEPEDEALLPSEQGPAFSFSFEEAPAAPDTQIPAVAETTESSEGFSFGFEEPAAQPEPAAAPPAEPDDPFAAFMASAGGEEAPAAAVETGAPAEVVATAATGGDDLDLDSLFGDNTGATATVAAAPADDALDLSDFGLGGVGAAPDFSADLSGFGAGLGGASAGEIDEATLYHALKPVLDTLVGEVRRSLEYHTSRYPDAAVQRVMIVGGGAKLKNMDAYLTQELGLPAVVGNPIAQLNVKAPQLPPGYVEENGTLFTVALGLAMRELTK